MAWWALSALWLHHLEKQGEFFAQVSLFHFFCHFDEGFIIHAYSRPTDPSTELQVIARHEGSLEYDGVVEFLDKKLPGGLKWRTYINLSMPQEIGAIRPPLGVDGFSMSRKDDHDTRWNSRAVSHVQTSRRFVCRWVEAHLEVLV